MKRAHNPKLELKAPPKPKAVLTVTESVSLELPFHYGAPAQVATVKDLHDFLSAVHARFGFGFTDVQVGIHHTGLSATKTKEI